jgi:hypothetical protein
VRGTVIAIQPGVSMYISDGTLTIEAQNPTPCGAISGALVDVVRFPGALEGRRALENSICRKVGETADRSDDGSSAELRNLQRDEVVT